MASPRTASRTQILPWLLLALGISLLLPATSTTSEISRPLQLGAQALRTLSGASPMLFDMQAPGCRLNSVCDGRPL